MKQKDILYIIVPLFIFTLVWIVTGIYHSAVSSTISEETNKNILPIEPTFNLKIINKLKERERIVPSFESVTASPSPAVVPIVNISTQNSSEGGKLPL